MNINVMVKTKIELFEKWLRISNNALKGNCHDIFDYFFT